MSGTVGLVVGALLGDLFAFGFDMFRDRRVSRRHEDEERRDILRMIPPPPHMATMPELVKKTGLSRMRLGSQLRIMLERGWIIVRADAYYTRTEHAPHPD